MCVTLPRVDRFRETLLTSAVGLANATRKKKPAGRAAGLKIYCTGEDLKIVFHFKANFIT